MKIGSKAWVMFMRKIYFTSESILVFCLTIKFMVWQQIIETGGFTDLFLKIGIIFFTFIVASFYFLSLFDQHQQKEKVNWSKVFPQLRKK